MTSDADKLLLIKKWRGKWTSRAIGNSPRALDELDDILSGKAQLDDAAFLLKYIGKSGCVLEFTDESDRQRYLSMIEQL